jgi:hypothetical protein
VFRRRASGCLWFSYSDEVEGGRGARNEKRLPCRTHEDQRMSQGRRLPNPNPTYTYVGPGLYSKRATTVEEGDTTLVESTEYGEYNNTNNSVINAAIGDIVDQPIFFLCRTRRNLTKNSIRGRLPMGLPSFAEPAIKLLPPQRYAVGTLTAVPIN